MGLQFNDNGVTRTLTLADMATQDFQEAYSDLYKGINGFRPRGHDTQTMLHFFDTYEAQFEESEEDDRRALKARSERDGIEYRSWSHYYDEKERRDYEAYEREQAARQAVLAERAEMYRRFSPLPVVEDWMYGRIA
jgi:hypothetical protein